MLRVCLALWLPAMARARQPHLVLMVLDDVGHHDVGYHGSDFPTPNIDRLATQGVRLERYYVQEVCSPTRSALMSGRQPFHTGIQRIVREQSRMHLPMSATTLAEALGQVGYRRHAVGKWHLGYASWNNTPTGRGFESHAGYFGGQGDYYRHTHDDGGTGGFDFWRNRTAAKDLIGKYSMDLYMEEAKRVIEMHNPADPLFLYFAHQVQHVPLQSPPAGTYSAKCDAIDASAPHGRYRHILCSMSSRMDAAIGEFVSMLQAKGIWEDTIMWVTTDNGGRTPQEGSKQSSVGCNFPLRGGKATLFEGGVKGVSFVTGGQIPAGISGSVRTGLVHHVDVPTTLAALGGADLGEGVDGFDVWGVITDGRDSPRTEVPVNIDNSHGSDNSRGNFSALIQGRWKLMNTGPTVLDGWWSSDPYRHTAPNSSQVAVTVDGWDVMLFDVLADPEERRNVAAANPDVVRGMLRRIEELADPANGYVPPQSATVDPQAAPELHDGCLAPWLDEYSESDTTSIVV